ncbi:M56 family metallopeptidase [Pseudozobellia thermophila]|uniref:TonB family C-terminal domain-containing protein n=1 Tax=Pseudozobellia thermophila TaxID=192903 RepID=A0A1M6MZI9_9FLAO|nr:M56 family metallopeptidase [Pseudozobellia thermophila]SHJ88743.1 TonB family C-terminal domain-containing protein [Pseudozobellia thermophila]
MAQYVLECIAFQLVFLAVYDFFLKRETFFQWNRFYLIGTYLLSLVLPWIKIETFKTTVPEKYYVYPEYLWGLNDGVEVSAPEASPFPLPPMVWVFVLGALASLIVFARKMWQLYRLRQTGTISYFTDFTRIVMADSHMAFSFFKSIFLGDKVLESEHGNIIKHELVHIRQRHTYDLLFFELMRIVGWFNPLVYVYQSRVSELHEFIADAEVAHNNKREHYELLLSQVFQTQDISFINQFFKSSLIKKRIVMLQKSKSSEISKLKYLALVPLLLGILFYTSCERDFQDGTSENTITVSNVESLTAEEEQDLYIRLMEHSKQGGEWTLVLKDDNSTITFANPANDNSFISGPNGVPIKARMQIESKVLESDFDIFESGLKSIALTGDKVEVPFRVVEEVPVFPGCENADDPRDCFQQSVQKHISKNFRYPEEAQKQGIEGKVSVIFTISEDGNITNIRKRGPHKLLEDEVERIISRLPRMEPGKQRGKAVNVPFSIPIVFKLQSSSLGTFAGDTPQEERMSMDEVMAGLNMVPFAEVDQAPIFPGCENEADTKACFQQSMQRHIRENFSYPQDAQERGVQGRVALVFTIAEDGSVQGIRYRGPDPSLEEEALRIIKKLPQMQPAIHQGKEVAVAYSIPITFKLQGDASGNEIQIRSIEGPDQEPLVYIDGKEVSYGELKKTVPETIESVNVLKGEAARKKYGEKGSHGVVEVTLKK